MSLDAKTPALYITDKQEEFISLLEKCFNAKKVTQTFYNYARLKRCTCTDWDSVFDYFTGIHMELIEELQRSEPSEPSHVLENASDKSNHLLDSGNMGVKQMVITDDAHYDRSLDWLVKRMEQIESATSEAERAKLMVNYDVVAEALKRYSQPEMFEQKKSRLDDYL